MSLKPSMDTGKPRQYLVCCSGLLVVVGPGRSCRDASAGSATQCAIHILAKEESAHWRQSPVSGLRSCPTRDRVSQATE